MKQKGKNLIAAFLTMTILLSNAVVLAVGDNDTPMHTIYSWEWKDKEQYPLLTESENGWELLVPDSMEIEPDGTNIAELLPKEILIITKTEMIPGQSNNAEESVPDKDANTNSSLSENENSFPSTIPETEDLPSSPNEPNNLIYIPTSTEEENEKTEIDPNPDVSDQQPATPEPPLEDIQTETENSSDSNIQEKTSIPLTWELSVFQNSSLYDGYTVSASLPKGYVLADNLSTPSVTVKFSGEDETTPSEVFSNQIVPDTITPAGTVVRLFDYWTDERFLPDNHEYNESDRSGGINADHFFKFGRGMTQVYSNGGVGEEITENTSINAWTGKPEWSKSKAQPRTGIVENVLENGYPVFAANQAAGTKDFDQNARTTRMSTDYLFNTTNSAGKQSFNNADGLFQINEDGYYYYDSSKNYAWFDEVSGNFKLYNNWGVVPAGTSPQGQFFPFNQPGDIFQTEENGNPKLDENGHLVPKTKDKLDSRSKKMNHYFGLTMSTRFVHKNDGITSTGKKIEYKFSGDDDVWVFIDNVLVADLGGIHDKASLNIDFSTGNITITGNDANGTITNPYQKTYTIRDAFRVAGHENQASWNESGNTNTFANDTYHTLKFYYLERGNTDSNMSLMFNLQPIPESKIIKADQEGNPMPGVTFNLYCAQRSEETDSEGNYEYTIVDENNPIFTGITDCNGELLLLDETDIPLTFRGFYKEYNTEYFVLRETTPDGYHTFDDIYLHYEPNSGIIVSENHWLTGSYASPKVTVTAPTVLYSTDTPTSAGKGEEVLNLSDDDLNLKDDPPEIITLAFKRLDMDKPYTDTSNWAPVSGCTKHGFKVWDNPNDGNLEERIRKAAQANHDDNHKNQFELTSGGAFQTTVEDIPGNIHTYYWYIENTRSVDYVMNSQVEYLLNYYYHNKETDEYIRLYANDFDREFATNISVANVKNYLLVKKVTERNVPMNGTTFALFKANDVQKYLKEDNTVDVNDLEGVVPYDSGITRPMNRTDGDKVTGDALLLFPTKKDGILEKGEYYLIETDSGNDRYSLNPHAVHVIVDNTGVYADAGSENDGISTDQHVGSILKSMLRFAQDDGVNATLDRIKVQLLKSDVYSFDGENVQWSEWVENPHPTQQQHLQFDPTRADNNDGLEYVPINIDGVPLLTKMESGWNKLVIRQCHNVDHYEGGYVTETTGTLYTANGSKVQNLENRDLTNLFSTLMHVIVKDNPIDPIVPEPESGTLTVSKMVVGNTMDQKQDFTFEVVLKNMDGTPLTGSYPYTGGTISNITDVIAPENGTLILDQEGKAIFQLKHGQKITISLPVGTQFEVSEQRVDGYTTTHIGTIGTIEKQVSHEASFTNTRTNNSLISIPVKKIWKDQSNEDGFRPKQIKVKLYANGKDTGKQLILSPENDWKGSFDNLLQSENGKNIVYTIKEIKVNGYSAEITGNAEDGFEIINRYTPNKPIDPDKPNKPKPDPQPDNPESGKPEQEIEIEQNGEDTATEQSDPSLISDQPLTKPSETGKNNPKTSDHNFVGLALSISVLYGAVIIFTANAKHK